MTIKKYDAVVIGGGPAGAAAGIFLSQLGFNVCIVEKKVYPRDTLCGEFLSREIITQLKEWGFLKEFLLMNPNQVKTFKLINTDGSFIAKTLSFDAYAISRADFDHFLLNKAKATNAAVLQPAKVTSIVRGINNYKIKISLGNNTITIESPTVIGAYGKQNLLDIQLERKFINVKSGYSGVKFHADLSRFKNFNSDEISIFAGNDFYCGINKINGDKVTVCYLENRKNHHNRSNLPLDKLFNRNERLKEIFSGMQFNKNDMYLFRGAGNIYFGRRETVKNGIFMIGDAAGMIAPLAGDGISIAVESAKILSVILAKLKNGQISHAEAEYEYATGWKEHFKKRFMVSSILQKIVFKNYTRNGGINFLRFYPGIMGPLFEMTRG